jgi:hypothetical protein
MKAGCDKQVYYSRDRVNLCTSMIIMFVIIVLFITPIYLLYSRVAFVGGGDSSSKEGGVALRISILLVFSLLFSAVLTLFTRAKRHEILGAAAA